MSAALTTAGLITPAAAREPVTSITPRIRFHARQDEPTRTLPTRPRHPSGRSEAEPLWVAGVIRRVPGPPLRVVVRVVGHPTASVRR